MMILVLRCLLTVLLMLVTNGSSGKAALPPVEKFGPITKWMSDPPPKGPMKPPLQDKYHSNHMKRGYHDPDDYYNQNYGYNLESLRVEDRVNTFAYQPNIDFLISQNCFVLNYQWPSQITLPYMTMSLSAENDVNIRQLRKSAPSGCFVILVGDKFVKRMDDIVRKVDYITSQMATKLVTYFAEKTKEVPVVELDKSPAIVNYTT